MKPLIPPRWADRFLEWYCHPDLIEEIQGDAYELFARHARTNSRKASFLYTWNVLRFFRFRNIRSSNPMKYKSNLSTGMIRSYITTGYRNMTRNVATSAINVMGLSVALGCSVLIFILLDSYYNLDSMHVRGQDIYLVANHVKEGDATKIWARSPAPLAGALRENAAVESVVRVNRSRAAVRAGDLVFNERIWFVDPSFLQVFSFDITSGNRGALKDKNQIILTEEMALKYFGREDPMGKVMSIKFDEHHRVDFVVGAVSRDTPANSSMYYDFLVSMEILADLKPGRESQWKSFEDVTFLLKKPNAGVGQLAGSLEVIRKTQRLAQPDWPVQDIELIPLKDVAQRSYDIENSLSWSNATAAMVAFAVVATFLVLLACFNYMNVAVASVATRLKEIGIRKVVGGGKKQIIQQFLVENIFLCAIALIAGTALAYFFLVPGFDALYPVKIAFEFSSMWTIVLFFGGLLLFVALISGAYPALYVSSFNAVSILKGKEKFGNRSLLSRILLGCQFTLSFTTIISCLVFIWASYYFETLDWGYKHDATIAVPLMSRAQFEGLRDRVKLNRHVTAWAGAESHIGSASRSERITVNGQERNVLHLPVGEGYLGLMGVRLKSGRYFDGNSTTDNTESVIINESFAKRMNWEKPIGQSFTLDNQKRYVIGVVENFHYDDFFANVEPVLFSLVSEDRFGFLIVQAEAGHINETLEFLKKGWHEVAPDDPWRGYLQEAVFESFFASNRANNAVGYFISGVALLLACMGLYGLVAYNLTRRMKEFSVRKVFGASLMHIFKLMNRDYAAIVITSFAIGAPLGSWLINMVIKSAFPDPIPVDLTPYLLTASMMLLTVILTVGSQLKRIAQENPTVTLRSE